jgi:hypothetical protein
LGNKAKWKSHLDIITMPPVGAKGVLHPPGRSAGEPT